MELMQTYQKQRTKTSAIDALSKLRKRGLMNEEVPIDPPRVSYFDSSLIFSPFHESSVDFEDLDAHIRHIEQMLLSRIQAYRGLPNNEQTRVRMADEIAQVMMDTGHSTQRDRKSVV